MRTVADVRNLHVGVSLTSEGAGHTTRMTALCQTLTREHTVSFWCAESAGRMLKPLFPGCRFSRIPPVPTVFKRNRVSNRATIRLNLPTFAHLGPTTDALRRQLEKREVNVVLSDYDPFLPIAAHKADIPVVLFNHQGVVDRHPALRPSWLLAMLVNRILMPRCDVKILSSFYNGDVGPLLRNEIIRQRPTHGGFVVVYARRGLKEQLLPALRDFRRARFRVFPSDEYDFAASLAACDGVIAPAGHQLISEVLYLRKPMLAFPQIGQYEQELNARMLVRSGWGVIGDIHCIRRSIARFVTRLDRFPLHQPDPDVRFCFQDDTPRAVHMVLSSLEKSVRLARLFGPRNRRIAVGGPIGR